MSKLSEWDVYSRRVTADMFVHVLRSHYFHSWNVCAVENITTVSSPADMSVITVRSGYN